MFNALKKRLTQTVKTIQPIKQASDRAENSFKNTEHIRGKRRRVKLSK